MSKLKLFGLVLLASVAYFVFNPQTSSAYIRHPSIPDSVEDVIAGECPKTTQNTIHAIYPNPSTISSSNDSGTTSLYSTAHVCDEAPSGYVPVTNIQHKVTRAVLTQGAGTFSLSGGYPSYFYPGNINTVGSFANPVSKTVTLSGLARNQTNCWNVYFTAYVPAHGPETGEGYWPFCVYYQYVPPTPVITSSAGCNANGTGYVKSTATRAGSTFTYTLSRWNGSTAWVDVMSATNRTSGVEAYFDVSQWTSGPSGTLQFFYIKVLDIGTGVTYNTPNNANGYFDVGPCVITAPATSLYSAKIDDKYVSATGYTGGGFYLGGNCYSVTANFICTDTGTGFTLAEYPFSDNCVKIGSGPCQTGNPYNSLYDISPGTYQVSITPSGQNDGTWTLRGYKICASSGTCTTTYLTQTPLSTGSSFTHTFQSGVNYYMRWIYTKPSTAVTCNPPSQTLGLNEATTLVSSGGNGTYAWSSSPAATSAVPSGSQYTVSYNSEGVKTVTVTSNGISAQCVITVVRKPYARFYGGDVSAGWGSNDASGTCAYNSNADIVTYNQGASTYAGGGVQIAAYAADLIHEFASAARRTASAAPPVVPGAPLPPIGLSFSNDTGAAGAYGGKWAAGNCAPDFYGSPASPEPDNSLIAGRTLGAGESVTIYVNGDAFIMGNIDYAPFQAYTPATIPRFKLIAKGNIYVNSTVNRIAGMYVAQPSGASGGTFYTCAIEDPAGTLRAPNHSGNTSSEMMSNCNNSLIVAGAVIAKNIKLLRTAGTVSAAAANDTQSSTNQAERFLYTPEVWIGLSTGGGLDLKAITGLPPIL